MNIVNKGVGAVFSKIKNIYSSSVEGFGDSHIVERKFCMKLNEVNEYK